MTLHSFAPAQFHSIADRKIAALSLADMVARDLRKTVQAKGRASLVVSGGSSPKPVYQALSYAQLPWGKVHVGLVDDRWVNPGESGSNETFVHGTLLQNEAKLAQFTGLKVDAQTPQDGLAEVERSMRAIRAPYDVAIMGMGTDGHTASWFPGARNLRDVMDIETGNAVTAIDATGCSVSGDHPLRVTLTVPAVLNTRKIYLFITGEKKLRVLQEAASQDVYDAPVQALFAAADRLSIVWAP